MPNFTGKQLNDLIQKQAKFSIKKSVSELVDIYKDRWDYQILNELSNQFTLENADTLKFLITKEFNIVKRIVKEISLIYKEPAERINLLKDAVKDKVSGEVTTERKIDENYQKMINDTDIHIVMKEVNRYVNLANNVMLKSIYRNNRMEFDILLFDNVEILTHPEDWTRIIAIKYYIGLQLPDSNGFTQADDPTKLRDNRQATLGTDLNTIWDEKFKRSILYTIEDFTEKDENDNTINFNKGYIYTYEQRVGSKSQEEILINKEENPYRDVNDNVILPFVLFSKTYPIYTLLDFSTGNDVIDANMNLAMTLIHLNELIKYQSYKQLFVVVDEKTKLPAKMKLSAKDVLKLTSREGVGSAGVLDMQANIDQLWKVTNERIVMIMGQYGISPQNFTMTGDAQSGLSIELNNRALLEMREDQVPVYRNREKDLFKVMRSVWNHHNQNDMIDIKGTFNIDFGEIEFPISEQEKAASMINLIRFNVRTPIDYIKDENPDLNDKQAMALFNKNKAINTTNRIQVQPIEQPGTPVVPTETEEA